MIIAALPFLSNLDIACCINNNCISPVPGNPAPNLPLNFFSCSANTAFSTPGAASFPPHGCPNGGFIITYLIFCSGVLTVDSKESLIIVS